MLKAVASAGATASARTRVCMFIGAKTVFCQHEARRVDLVYCRPLAPIGCLVRFLQHVRRMSQFVRGQVACTCPVLGDSRCRESPLALHGGVTMRHDGFCHTILLYGHGGSGNRGCEAIVRSTAQILHDTLGRDTEIGVASVRPHEDDQAGIPCVSQVIAHRAGRGTPAWFMWQFVKSVLRNPMLAESIALHQMTEVAGRLMLACR